MYGSRMHRLFSNSSRRLYSQVSAPAVRKPLEAGTILGCTAVVAAALTAASAPTTTTSMECSRCNKSEDNAATPAPRQQPRQGKTSDVLDFSPSGQAELEQADLEQATHSVATSPDSEQRTSDVISFAPPPEDEDDASHLPNYISKRFAGDLGTSLDHKMPISRESQFILASEHVYPQEKAKLTLAPDVPPPINRNHPVHLVVDLSCTNKETRILGNKKYEYWPFGYYDYRERKHRYGVPGPFIRARVGDVLQVNFTNNDESGMAHSVDFHAVCGPGGGAPTTFAEQDETKTGAYLLTRPGLYVYHCAAAPIPVHIHNGMFGLVLVEPPDGLPPVDREFYIMQSELYLEEDEDDRSTYIMNHDAAADERPSHVVFNGADGALVEKPIVVKQDEKIRLFVGNAGPNLVSSFHVIGTIFEEVYHEGSLTSAPKKDVQTTLIPAGGAAVIDMKMQVPGSFAIVDHSIFRIDKGAIGMIKVKGKPRPELFDSMEPPVYCVGCKVHQ